MTDRLGSRDESISIAVLRWSLALVLGGQAFVVLLHIMSLQSGSGAEHLHGPHGPDGVAFYLMIAGTELVGSLLLLVPRTRVVGGVAVLVSLAGATASMLSEGSKPPLAFVIYVVALLVVLQHGPARSEPRLR
jgi:hypothetical protein